jgi:hypothetical protein
MEGSDLGGGDTFEGEDAAEDENIAEGEDAAEDENIAEGEDAAEDENIAEDEGQCYKCLFVFIVYFNTV